MKIGDETVLGRSAWTAIAAAAQAANFAHRRWRCQPRNALTLKNLVPFGVARTPRTGKVFPARGHSVITVRATCNCQHHRDYYRRPPPRNEVGRFRTIARELVGKFQERTGGLFIHHRPPPTWRRLAQHDHVLRLPSPLRVTPRSPLHNEAIAAPVCETDSWDHAINSSLCASIQWRMESGSTRSHCESAGSVSGSSSLQPPAGCRRRSAR